MEISDVGIPDEKNIKFLHKMYDPLVFNFW